MYRDEAAREAARFNGRGLEELYRERLLPDASHPRPPHPRTFHREERHRGRRANVLQGLRLHAEVLSRSEQMQVLFFCRAMAELGRDGHLVGRTYSAPAKWRRGKGRVTVQLGCCYNYAQDREGNPPGILPRERVAGMPPFLRQLVDTMIDRRVLRPSERPDSCIINFYSEGDCIPPHIDHHDFDRPFVTLSLLSEQPILFGTEIGVAGDGEFTAPFRLMLPVGSVLVLDGNGATPSPHHRPLPPLPHHRPTCSSLASH